MARSMTLSFPPFTRAIKTLIAINAGIYVLGLILVAVVQVGVANLIRVEITSGLTEKDTVALGAINNRELSNGLPVKIVD